MKKLTFLLFVLCMILISLIMVSCEPRTIPSHKSSKGKDTKIEGKTYTIYSTPSMDGEITWSSASGNYTASAGDTSISIGDYDNDPMVVKTVTRGFISFDLSSIPGGAQIESAVFRIYQNSNYSGDSYSDPPAGLGNVHVGVVSYNIFDSSAYDNGNWNAGNIGILSTTFTANTWHTLDVTSNLTDELETYKTGRLQFTIRHEHENNNDGPTPDTDGWTMGDSMTNQPELVVTIK